MTFSLSEVIVILDVRVSLYLDNPSSAPDPRFVWTCPNCGYARYPGLTHGCPTGLMPNRTIKEPK